MIQRRDEIGEQKSEKKSRNAVLDAKIVRGIFEGLNHYSDFVQMKKNTL